MPEERRPVHIVEYAPYYSVTASGEVWSTHRGGRRLRTSRNARYFSVGLSANGVQQSCMVHVLVAHAWLGTPPAVGLTVNHKDGNKHNNHATNLEWCTPLENTQHAIATGLTPERLGDTNPNARWTPEQVAYIRSFPYKHGLFSKLARELGTVPCSIRYAYYWWGGRPRPYKR